jgi:hypothetical protein
MEMTTTTFDKRMARIESGERLSHDELLELSSAPDLLPLGMLADALRRRMRGTAVTFLRVAVYPVDSIGGTVPPAACEIRLSGAPGSLDAAVSAVAHARALAGDRIVAAFAWSDIERIAGPEGAAGRSVPDVLRALRQAGLDALAELPLDTTGRIDAAVEMLRAEGFQQRRLGIETADVPDRLELWTLASELQDRYACIQTIDPLPSRLRAFRPTTGYQDVKLVATARLAVPNVPTIQVDWQRYGPKLAQVALTFGADDLDGVSPSEEATEGRRRAPLEEVRRNIEAAGFEPVERDGRFTLCT